MHRIPQGRRAPKIQSTETLNLERLKNRSLDAARQTMRWTSGKTAARDLPFPGRIGDRTHQPKVGVAVEVVSQGDPVMDLTSRMRAEGNLSRDVPGAKSKFV
jgi:hypothetical protein